MADGRTCLSSQHGLLGTGGSLYRSQRLRGCPTRTQTIIGMFADLGRGHVGHSPCYDASLYFAIIGLCGIFFQMEGLAGSMLKCSGNMKIPSLLNICMCAMDVIFNYFFIYILDLGVMGAAMGTGV